MSSETANVLDCVSVVARLFFGLTENGENHLTKTRELDFPQTRRI